MAADTPMGRLVGGVWCGDVLAALPDFVEGTLEPARLAEVRAHLDGCDWCERFGGSYAGVVTSLRAGPEGEQAPDVTERVLARLEAD